MNRAKLLLLVSLGIMMIILVVLIGIMGATLIPMLEDTFSLLSGEFVMFAIYQYAPLWYPSVALVLLLGLWLMVLRTHPASDNTLTADRAVPAESPSSFRGKWVLGSVLAWAAYSGIHYFLGKLLELRLIEPMYNLADRLFLSRGASPEAAESMLFILLYSLPGTLRFIFIGPLLGGLLAAAQWIALARIHPQVNDWARYTFWGIFASFTLTGTVTLILSGLSVLSLSQSTPSSEFSLPILWLYASGPILSILTLVSYWLGGMLAARWQARLPETNATIASWRKYNPWLMVVGGIFGPVTGIIYGLLTASIMQRVCFGRQIDFASPQAAPSMDVPVS